ncbi:MAG: hypothetical protein ACI9J2_000801 [Saprospiraceae bacterium]|jgi:hypothetical protein
MMRISDRSEVMLAKASASRALKSTKNKCLIAPLCEVLFTWFMAIIDAVYEPM